MAIALAVAQVGSAAVAILALMLAARVWSKDRARSAEIQRLSGEIRRRDRADVAEESRVEGRGSRPKDADSVGGARPSPVSTPSPEPMPGTLDELASARKVPSTRRDGPDSYVPRGPILIAVPDLAPEATTPGAIPEDLSLRYAAIWDLAESGASAEAIARATERPVGQVELILGLRRTRTAANRG